MIFNKQNLTHWVDERFKNDVLKGKEKFVEENVKIQLKFYHKPIGFWISVNNSWENWLEGNWESWVKNKVCLKVELANDINLFIIKSKQQFLNKYKELTGKNLLDLEITEKFDMSNFHEELKKHYDGMMLLSDPFYKHRLDIDFNYFYSWDCESICVWNKNKIKFKENIK